MLTAVTLQAQAFSEIILASLSNFVHMCLVDSQQTLHGRLMDLKEQLNPLVDQAKYHSKFKLTGTQANPQTVYESKSYQFDGPFNRRRSTQG